jgi:8-oxo-dGTP diphosphatase
MANPPLRIALVILEDQAGRVAFQLRSEVEGIANPGHWGLFGGHIEPGEAPLAGAVREAEEELTVHLDRSKMRQVAQHQRQNPPKKYYDFHYPVTDELDQTRLTEGERWVWLTRQQIETGEVDGKPIVSYHCQWVLEFWDRQRK